MTDNSGNIIYLVAVIVAVLSSVLSKMKKSRVDENPAPSASPKSWQDVIREITMAEEERKPQVSVQTAGSPSKIQSKPFLEEERKIHKEHIVKNSPIKTDILQLQEEEQVANVSLPDFSNLDELKRGFIFSEVFRRKF